MPKPIKTNSKPNQATPAAGNQPSLWGWQTMLSIGITLAVFAVLASYVDFQRLRQEVGACSKWLLVLAGLLHYGTYPVRGLRWKYSLRHLPTRCGNARFGLIVFFYNFIDNIVPAKLGDLYAGHMARINCGIRRSSALGSILFLRTLDSWVVFGLAALASWSLFKQEMPPSVTWALVIGCLFAAAATTAMLLFIWLKRKVPAWLPEPIRHAIEAFRSGMWPNPKELVPISGLTLAIWTMEILWILVLTMAFGLRFGTAETIFLTTIPLIASVFPITPSGAGVVDLTLFTCLRVIGVPSPLAVSVTVVNRLIDYWLHILLGALTWMISRHIGLRIWKDMPGNPGENDYMERPLSEQGALNKPDASGQLQMPGTSMDNQKERSAWQYSAVSPEDV